MGYRELTLKLPPDFTADELHNSVCHKLRIRECRHTIIKQSLDARRKNNIHWQVQVAVTSPAIKGKPPAPQPKLEIPHRNNRGTVLVIGNGPAGFFAALVLQAAGFSTIMLDRGADADQRKRGIQAFEKNGVFDPHCNYAFGEGGAGTFSDGKLTARSKHISREKQFIIDHFIRAGAPPETAYLAHPHLGSDNLVSIAKRLRENYQEMGGTVHFKTLVTDIKVSNSRITKVITNHGDYEADYIIFAPGHSAYDTYRMLIRKGVRFRTKNFAIGCRVEHPQALINRAQWGCENLPGVKAAEYRLTCNSDNHLPVYTFCMCPGGTVVPATAAAHTNIVNGMSFYKRNGPFANAACVAGIQLDRLLKKDIEPSEALDWLEALEHRFYEMAPDQRAPACSIQHFIHGGPNRLPRKTSHPRGMIDVSLQEHFPAEVTRSLQHALQNFSRKLPGFDTGVLLGLESKTSAPIQTIREDDLRCAGFDNLYIAGEGSGYSGGIISSAADGIRIALQLCTATP